MTIEVPVFLWRRKCFSTCRPYFYRIAFSPSSVRVCACDNSLSLQIHLLSVPGLVHVTVLDVSAVSCLVMETLRWPLEATRVQNRRRRLSVSRLPVLFKRWFLRHWAIADPSHSAVSVGVQTGHRESHNRICEQVVERVVCHDESSLESVAMWLVCRQHYALRDRLDGLCPGRCRFYC